MKFAIAALLGSTSAFTADTKPVWGLRSVKDHRVDSGIQKEYGIASTEAANARPPLQSNVQFTADTKPVWGLRSVKDHREDSTIQKEYGATSTAAANARPPL